MDVGEIHLKVEINCKEHFSVLRWIVRGSKVLARF